MARFIILAIIISFLFSCKQKAHEKLVLGAWKVDSTYNFYNGFEMRETEDGSDWATYVFDDQGIVKEIKYGTFRSYQYRFNDNKMIWLLEEYAEESEFEILKLFGNQMVLKKVKPPVFPGDNQVRYEIRYFSRTETPAPSLFDKFESSK